MSTGTGGWSGDGRLRGPYSAMRCHGAAALTAVYGELLGGVVVVVGVVVSGGDGGVVGVVGVVVVLVVVELYVLVLVLLWLLL